MPAKRLSRREREERRALQSTLEQLATDIAYMFMDVAQLWKVCPPDEMTDVEWGFCLDGLACIYLNNNNPKHIQAYQIGDLAREIIVGNWVWNKKMITWAEERVKSKWGKL